MAAVKRGKLVDEDDVAYVNEIEIEIEIKRVERGRIEREEEDRRRERRTGFEEVQGERCGLSVKASEEKTELEEEVTLVLAGMKETNAEMEVVVLRERRDDGGGGGEEEGIEVVVVPAANKPVKPRDRSNGKKRKAVTQVEEQPRKVKKVKTALPKTRKPHPNAWTAEEDAALVEGVNEYGLDFDRIKVEAGARLGDRKATALDARFKRAELTLRHLGS